VALVIVRAMLSSKSFSFFHGKITRPAEELNTSMFRFRTPQNLETSGSIVQFTLDLTISFSCVAINGVMLSRLSSLARSRRLTGGQAGG
jgi:hypothetical protein